MNIFKFFFSRTQNIAKPDFIYILSGDKLSKFNYISNTNTGSYLVTDFLTHAETSKKEVANKNSINFWDRLLGTQKYLDFSKSVKGFYNEEKVWKILSKKYIVIFSQELDHHGVDILISKNGKDFFGFQIKSSNYYADHFRQTDKFKNVHGLIIVGYKFNSNEILQQVKNIVDKYKFS